MEIYLAGAIRDGVVEDVDWRERIIREVRVPGVRYLNPMGGKTFYSKSKVWRYSGGVVAGAPIIVKHDFWCVNRADAVIFNFRALSQKYPNIGTLVEFGAAANRYPHCLVYSIIDPDYTGHENPALYKLHPFLSENSAVVFPTIDECIAFLKGHLPVLVGAAPSFGGYRAEE